MTGPLAVLRSALDVYRDESWEADDCGGSRLLCSLMGAVVHDPAHDDREAQRLLLRELSTWADSGIHPEDVDLLADDGDSWVALGDWEGRVLGQSDDDAADCVPLPRHPVVERALANAAQAGAS